MSEHVEGRFVVEGGILVEARSFVEDGSFVEDRSFQTDIPDTFLALIRIDSNLEVKTSRRAKIVQNKYYNYFNK